MDVLELNDRTPKETTAGSSSARFSVKVSISLFQNREKFIKIKIPG
jgi:hypothetical protein